MKGDGNGVAYVKKHEGAWQGQHVGPSGSMMHFAAPSHEQAFAAGEKALAGLPLTTPAKPSAPPMPTKAIAPVSGLPSASGGASHSHSASNHASTSHAPSVTPPAEPHLPPGWTKTPLGNSGKAVYSLGKSSLNFGPYASVKPHPSGGWWSHATPVQADDDAPRYNGSHTRLQDAIDAAHDHLVSHGAVPGESSDEESSDEAAPAFQTASPTASPAASHADADAAMQGGYFHPHAKAKLHEAIDAGLTPEQLAQVIGHVAPLKHTVPSGKVIPSHVTAAVAAVKNGTPMTPTPTAPPKPAQAPQTASVGVPGASPGVPSPAPTPRFVTLNGQRHTAPTGPGKGQVTAADVDHVHGLLGGQASGFSPNGLSALKQAAADGKVKSLAHLYQLAAIAKASSTAGGYAHATSSGVASAVAHGSIPALKQAAEGGDAGAKSVLANLGPNSFYSPAEQAAHAEADKVAAFHALTPAEILAHKTGGALGSNTAGASGVYQVSHQAGEHKIYVKEMAADRVHQEHLANEVYRALGHAAPHTRVLQTAPEQGGKTMLASLWHDHEGLLGQGGKLTPEELAHLGEWIGLGPRGKNPDYAKLFTAAGVKSMGSAPGMASEIAKIEALAKQPGGWQGFVDKHAPGLPAEKRAHLAAILDKRTALLSQKRMALLDTQGGSQDALAGSSYLEGGHETNGSDWKGPLAAYRKFITGSPHSTAVTKHFSGLLDGYGVKQHLHEPIGYWTGSSSGHKWQQDWPDYLAGKTTPGALAVKKILETRRARWEKLAAAHNLPFPETFLLHRGMQGSGTDADTKVVPHTIAAWRNPDEGYMKVKSKAASSWSLSKQKAEEFAGSYHGTPGQAGVVYSAHIPFEQTLSDMFLDDHSYLHSFPHENEVVAGGQHDHIVVPKSGVEVHYKGKKYTYADREALFDAYAKEHGGKLPNPKSFGINVSDLPQNKDKSKKTESVKLGEHMASNQASEDGANQETVQDAFWHEHKKKLAAWDAKVEKAGVTPAPTKGVKALGSFAQDDPDTHFRSEEGKEA